MGIFFSYNRHFIKNAHLWIYSISMMFTIMAWKLKSFDGFFRLNTLWSSYGGADAALRDESSVLSFDFGYLWNMGSSERRTHIFQVWKSTIDLHGMTESINPWIQNLFKIVHTIIIRLDQLPRILEKQYWTHTASTKYGQYTAI